MVLMLPVNERSSETTYPQKANIMMKRRFINPAATSELLSPAIIMLANVLVNMKNIQTWRNVVMPRESTEFVAYALR
jgi:hypothetical protein